MHLQLICSLQTNGATTSNDDNFMFCTFGEKELACKFLSSAFSENSMVKWERSSRNIQGKEKNEKVETPEPHRFSYQIVMANASGLAFF
ncbi:hypothetical protein NL676_019613 [Syzygium grande]|nr:hypothetical protein NL676_019613 [Syzygium grande]